MTVVVNNISPEPKAFIVARNWKGELWYWGSWDSEEVAKSVAVEVNGIVVER